MDDAGRRHRPPPASRLAREPTSVTDALSRPAPTASESAAQPMLALKNVEVIYDHVILVLKGVSLEVPAGRHRRPPRCKRRGQIDHAEVDLQPAALRARRGHQGLDRLPRRAGGRPHAQRSGSARLHPGDGGTPLLRPPHRGGEPADGLVHAPRRARSRRGRHGDGLRLFSRASRSGACRWRATSRAASSRWWRSAAR